MILLYAWCQSSGGQNVLELARSPSKIITSAGPAGSTGVSRCGRRLLSRRVDRWYQEDRFRPSDHDARDKIGFGTDIRFPAGRICIAPIVISDLCRHCSTKLNLTVGFSARGPDMSRMLTAQQPAIPHPGVSAMSIATRLTTRGNISRYSLLPVVVPPSPASVALRLQYRVSRDGLAAPTALISMHTTRASDYQNVIHWRYVRSLVLMWHSQVLRVKF